MEIKLKLRNSINNKKTTSEKERKKENKYLWLMVSVFHAIVRRVPLLELASLTQRIICI